MLASDNPPSGGRIPHHGGNIGFAIGAVIAISSDDTDREDFVVWRQCTVENRAAVLGVRPQAVYQAVAGDRAARAEWDQSPGCWLVILDNPLRRADENPNPESWNSEGLHAERCPVPLYGTSLRYLFTSGPFHGLLSLWDGRSSRPVEQSFHLNACPIFRGRLCLPPALRANRRGCPV